MHEFWIKPNEYSPNNLIWNTEFDDFYNGYSSITLVKTVKYDDSPSGYSLRIWVEL